MHHNQGLAQLNFTCQIRMLTDLPKYTILLKIPYPKNLTTFNNASDDLIPELRRHICQNCAKEKENIFL